MRTRRPIGLVNRVVPASKLRTETLKLARRIAEASDVVVTLGKRAYYTQIDLDQPKAYTDAQDVMTRNALSPDAPGGISAFLEKRPPRWTGNSHIALVSVS
jgi:enoyl-CoA hydratase/carnithine racemase